MMYFGFVLALLAGLAPLAAIPLCRPAPVLVYEFSMTRGG